WRRSACRSRATDASLPGRAVLLADLRYAWRLLRRAPGAAATAVLTLAIGVGANTAIFSVIRAVLSSPGAVDADRVGLIREQWPARPGARPISRLNYLDWAGQSTVFDRIAAVTWGDATIAGGTVPIHVHGLLVSPAYFGVFGLTPALGRTFAR